MGNTFKFSDCKFTEDEIFALNSFFMQFGKKEAILWFRKNFNNSNVENNLKSAINRLEETEEV